VPKKQRFRIVNGFNAPSTRWITGVLYLAQDAALAERPLLGLAELILDRPVSVPPTEVFRVTK